MEVLDYKIESFSSMPETKEEEKKELKCQHCHRVALNGISDFHSLIGGSTSIKKTCKKCRMETYKSYKKNNPDKFKKKDEKDKNIADDIKEYKRCPQCSRKTVGIEDYKHYKSDRTCKNCKKCRLSVLECYRKKKKLAPKKKTQKDEILELKEIIRKIDEDITA